MNTPAMVAMTTGSKTNKAYLETREVVVARLTAFKGHGPDVDLYVDIEAFETLSPENKTWVLHRFDQLQRQLVDSYNRTRATLPNGETVEARTARSCWSGPVPFYLHDEKTGTIRLVTLKIMHIIKRKSTIKDYVNDRTNVGIDYDRAFEIAAQWWRPINWYCWWRGWR